MYSKRSLSPAVRQDPFSTGVYREISLLVFGAGSTPGTGYTLGVVPADPLLGFFSRPLGSFDHSIPLSASWGLCRSPEFSVYSPLLSGILPVNPLGLASPDSQLSFLSQGRQWGPAWIPCTLLLPTRQKLPPGPKPELRPGHPLASLHPHVTHHPVSPGVLCLEKPCFLPPAWSFGCFMHEGKSPSCHCIQPLGSTPPHPPLSGPGPQHHSLWVGENQLCGSAGPDAGEAMAFWAAWLLHKPEIGEGGRSWRPTLSGPLCSFLLGGPVDYQSGQVRKTTMAMVWAGSEGLNRSALTKVFVRARRSFGGEDTE